MRRTAAPMTALLLLAGCTAPQGERQSAVADAAGAGPPVACIDLNQVTSRRPAGAQSILFELTGSRNYRNDLPDHCPGLVRAGAAHIVAVEAAGSQLCRGDRISVYDPAEAKNLGPQAFPKCRLGDFVPVASVGTHR